MPRNPNHDAPRLDRSRIGVGGRPVLGLHLPDPGSLVFWDTETYPALPGLAAPPVVCLQWATLEGPVHVLNASDALRWWSHVLASGCTLVAHGVAFDVGVMVAASGSFDGVWEAFDAGRIVCTLVREKLRNIACSPVTVPASLAEAVRQRWGYRVEGKDGADAWRLRYHELAALSLGRWPADALQYAADDVAWLRALWRDQQRPLAIPYVHDCRAYTAQLIGGGPDEQRQTLNAFALQMTGAWGLRADPDRADDAHRGLVAHAAQLRAQLMSRGIYTSAGALDTKALGALVEAEWTPELGPIPRTKGRKDVSTSKDTLQRLAHPTTDTLLELRSAEKTAQFLAGAGSEHPICAHYNVLVATGRTSCSDPNVQQLPREGGVRECFVPRDGYVFVSVDYDALELRAWAQVTTNIFGAEHSTLRARFAADPAFDPHTAFAATVLGITYPEAMLRKKAGDAEVKHARGLGKVGNFGLIGGMGVRTLVDYARSSFGITVTYPEAVEIRKTWATTWPEGERYLDWIGANVAYARSLGISEWGGWTLRQLTSGRLRAACSYTNGANTWFQGLAADGAKAALARVARESVSVPRSPLYGCRPVWFIHDEIGVEAPRVRASAAADRLIKVMEGVMERWTPDVPSRASATLMTRWSKRAESRRIGGAWTVWSE